LAKSSYGALKKVFSFFCLQTPQGRYIGPMNLNVTELKVTAANTTPDNVHDLHVVAEASELGLKPGELPNKLPTTLGNGQDFLLVGVDDSQFIYQQSNGCFRLTVFND
jgi:hypothetical protein